jgi:hypothetical protein
MGVGVGCWCKTTRWMKMNKSFGHKNIYLSCSLHIKQIVVFVTTHSFIFSCKTFKTIKHYVMYFPLPMMKPLSIQFGHLKEHLMILFWAPLQ